MKTPNIITGLDIGSNYIRIVVGQLVKVEDNDQLNIIGVVEVPSQGISRGSVVSIEETVSTISSALEKTERMIGMPIENIWLGVSGHHVNSNESNGVIAIARANGEIQEDDVERVIDSARSVSAPVNYEILHIIPKVFSVDSQTGIKDPVGMAGIRLEVTTQVIRGLSSQIKNLTKSVYRTGLDINDLVLSGLASSEAVLSLRQKELGVALVDIGSSTTDLVVFEDGDLIHAAVLPIGSDHITSDLAIGLQTSLEVAERVKLDYGHCLPSEFDKKEEINLKELGGDDQTFSRRYIAEIIEARTEEIFMKVDQELQKINRSGLLPAGIVLVGGGSKTPGKIELSKKITKLPVAIGSVKKFNTAVDKVNDISFSTALGLVLWGYQMLSQDQGGKFKLGNRFKILKEVGDKTKRWFKNLIS